MASLTGGLEPGALLVLLAIMAVAGYLHTVSGFGLGMIVMGAAGGFGVAPVPVLAILISLVTLANSAVALPGGWHGLEWQRVAALAAGIVPSIIVGVWLLSWLSATYTVLLTLLLGALVFYGGLSIGMNQRPLREPSPSWTFAISGTFSGLCGGLFGVAGPPVIYHCYRQPLPLKMIRQLLILCFAITSGVRTLFVASQGDLTVDVWAIAFWSIPVVAIATGLARRYPVPASPRMMRRVAMLALICLGLTIMIKSIFQMALRA